MQVPDTGTTGTGAAMQPDIQTEEPIEQVQTQPEAPSMPEEEAEEASPYEDLSDSYAYKRVPASNPRDELNQLRQDQTTYVPPEEQERQLVEKREKADNAYAQIRDVIKGATPTETGGQVVSFVLDTAADAFEDAGNMAIEVAESVNNFFGGDLSLERITAVSDSMPDGEFRQSAIDMIQVMASYAIGVKQAQNIIKTTGKFKKGVDLGVKLTMTFASEAVFNDTMEMMMSESMLKGTPYMGDLVRYIESDLGDDALLRSAKIGMYGVLDMVMMENVIKMAKVLKNTRLGQKALDKITPNAFKSKSSAPSAGKPSAVVGDELPEVSPEMVREGAVESLITKNLKAKKQALYMKDGNLKRQNLPPIPDDEILDVPAMIQGRPSATYNPNTIRTVDAAGNPVRRNLMRLDTTDEIRLAIGDFMEANKDALGKAVIDNNMLRDAAKIHGMTVEKMGRWAQKNGLSLGEVLAARQVHLDATEQFHQLSKMFMEGKLPLEMYAVAHETYQNLTRVISNMESLSSAMLRESAVDIGVREGAAPLTKMAEEAKKETAKTVKKILETGEELVRIHGEDAYPVIARAINNIGSDRIAQFMKRTVRQTADFAVQLGYASMLSSPAMLIRNAIVATSMMGTHLLETLTAAGIGSLRMRGQNFMSKSFGKPAWVQDKIDVQEALVMTHGMMQGTAEAIIISAKMGTNKATFGRFFGDIMDEGKNFGGQYGLRPDRDRIPFQALEGTEDGLAGVRLIKNVLTIPGKAIKHQDDATKHVALRMKLNQEAYREQAILMRKGVPADQAAVQAEGVMKTLLTPKKVGQLLEFGEELTFTNQPANNWLAALTDSRKGLPQTAVSIMVPFPRAAYNVAVYTFDRIPIANMLIKSNREIIKNRALDPRAFDMFIAKSVTVSSGIGTLGYYLNSKDMLVGARPDRDGRLFDQSGIQEKSIRIGDKTITVFPESPIGAMLMAVQTIAELRDIVQDDDSDFIPDATTVIMQAFSEAIDVDFFAEGVGALLEAITSDDAERLERLMQLGVDVGGRLLPANSLYRRLTRSGEDGQYVMDTNPGRLLTNMFQAIINEAMSVYAPEGLPYRRDFFGEKIEHSKGLGGWISPFNFKTANKDPVMLEMINLAGNFENRIPERKRVGDAVFEQYEVFPAPSRSIRTLDLKGLKPRRLNNNEYERLSLYSAGIDPDTEKPISEGYTYRDAMKELFDREEYKSFSIERKRLQAHMLHRAFMTMGAGRMRGEYLDRESTADVIDAFMERLKDDDGLPPISF